MTKVFPYLNFAGNTEEAFNFYQSVFGGEFSSVVRFSDTPAADKMPENERDKIMHIGLPINDSVILMATDTLESAGHKLVQGNNHYISLHPESREEAKRLYDGLSADGEIEMELHDAFWGDYFGSFTDKFGVQWMINYNPNQ
ncbi:MAG: VOC family protein [Balneolaceae bacterium]|nr:VOC family protein [Balneolaceae bacterium]